MTRDTFFLALETPAIGSMEPSTSKAQVQKIIAITGGSGSGKSTFVRMLRQALGEDQCLTIEQDHYCIDQSHRFDRDGGAVNFDHPSAYDLSLMAQQLLQLKQGQWVERPCYDFQSHKRLKQYSRLEPRPFILLDGTLILQDKELLDASDLSCFIDSPENLRFERRLARDTQERGRDAEGVKRQFFNQVKPMHDQFVEPCKATCDWIISAQSLEHFENEIVRILLTLKSKDSI